MVFKSNLNKETNISGNIVNKQMKQYFKPIGVLTIEITKKKKWEYWSAIFIISHTLAKVPFLSTEKDLDNWIELS